MATNSTVPSHIPELHLPKRVIDYVNAYQRDSGLTDQEVVDQLDLGSIEVLNLLRQGKLRFSFRLFSQLCTMLGWSLNSALLAMSAEQHLDLAYNLDTTFSPFMLKELEDVFNAHDDLKQGKALLFKQTVDGVTVLMFREEKQAG